MRYFVVVKNRSPKHKKYEVSGFAEMQTRMRQEKNFYSCASIVGIRVSEDCGIELFAVGEFSEPGNNAGDLSDGSRLESSRSEECGDSSSASEVCHDRTDDGGETPPSQSGYCDRVEPAKETEEATAVYCSAHDYCGL